MSDMRWVVWGAGLTLVTLLAGCGGGSPTSPTPSNRPQLAGGGRGANADDPAGGGENSGPQSPAFDEAPGYLPIFYADLNCFGAEFTSVFTNQTDFQTWWTTAVSCQPRYNTMTESPFGDPNNGGGGSTPGDPGDGTIEPEPYDPYPADAPVIDFSEYTVVAIGLAPDAAYGKGIWVSEVVSDTEGTTIKYEVSRPGDDCDFGAPEMSNYAPTIAALVPAGLTTPIAFERTDTVWNCTWEPDPNEPWTVYYTDAECALGPNEAVITDEATWTQWLDAAFDCDLARWNDPIFGQPGTGVGGGEVPPSTGGGGNDPAPEPDYPPKDHDDRENPVTDGGVDPAPPSPGSWGIDVDFDTHIVIVLRGGAQTRWGGGLWLNSVETGASGTSYEYTVMQPTGQCPDTDGYTMYPTVAIRVPKPTGTISFVRHLEQISCEWDEDKPMPAPVPLPAGDRPNG